MTGIEAPLGRAVVRTFEELCWLPADVVSDHAGAAPGPCAIVRFGGDACGFLAAEIDEATLREAYANMLGEDAPPGAPTGDVLREIANVICGHALTLVAGTAATFTLAPPELLDAPPEGAATATVACRAGAGLARIRLVLQPVTS